VIASIVGLLTYGQARGLGWKLALGELVLAGIALVGFLFLHDTGIWSDLRQRSDFPKIMFFSTVTLAGAVFLIGELLRRRLRWNLLPRHAGWIAFVGTYVLLNVISIIIRLKAPS
jgi:hypothetical protein